MNQKTNSRPEIFWIVGSDTDVGKTTLACALIGLLNERGTRTAGFKPVSGIELRKNVDFMLSNYPNSDCTLYGGDALKLSLSSPLTDERMVEVLSPVHFLTYPVHSRGLMLRTGASMLGNLEIYRTRKMEHLKSRRDIARIIKRASLPVAHSKLTDRNLASIGTDDAAHAKCSASFSFLVKLGCDAIVMEGASRLLPAWKGTPDVDHVFVCGDGVVTFFPNINSSADCGNDSRIEDMKSVDALKILLGTSPRTRHTEPFYVAGSEDRTEVARHIMKTLLGRQPNLI